MMNILKMIRINFVIRVNNFEKVNKKVEFTFDYFYSIKTFHQIRLSAYFLEL